MNPHDRIAEEKAYLDSKAQLTRLRIQLQVRSSGVSFAIVNPSTGAVHRSEPVPTANAHEFKRALDRAVSATNLWLPSTKSQPKVVIGHNFHYANETER